MTGMDRMRASSRPFSAVPSLVKGLVGDEAAAAAALGSVTREKKRLKMSTLCQVKQHLMTKM